MPPRQRRRPSLHRLLVAAEAVLFLGVLRDWVWSLVRRSELANWSKVVLAMALTLGLLGGLIVVARALFVRGLARTHAEAGRAAGTTLLLHLALLAVLFALYARMLGIDPLKELP
jgi:hypothetical protein